MLEWAFLVVLFFNIYFFFYFYYSDLSIIRFQLTRYKLPHLPLQKLRDTGLATLVPRYPAQMAERGGVFWGN